jgi:hypothetical protein
MRKIVTENCVVTFPDDQATKDAVFERIVAFCAKHEAFSGETMAQCDGPQLDIVGLMCDLIDDVMRFDVKDKGGLSALDGDAAEDRCCSRCGAALPDDQEPGECDTCVGERGRGA